MKVFRTLPFSPLLVYNYLPLLPFRLRALGASIERCANRAETELCPPSSVLAYPSSVRARVANHIEEEVREYLSS